MTITRGETLAIEIARKAVLMQILKSEMKGPYAIKVNFQDPKVLELVGDALMQALNGVSLQN